MNKIFWKSAIWAGVIAGITMLVLEMVMNPLFMGTPMWGPSRMIGGILLGKDVLPPPATFHMGALLSATVVHFPLSIIYAVIIGWIIKKMPMGVGILVGAIIGLAVYLLNFYVFTALFPWFANARNWVQIVIHVLFGVIAAWSFSVMYLRKS